MKCKECKKSDCKHENVKYHSCCMKVRCEDCGQEWETRCFQHYIPYVPYVEPCVEPYSPYVYPGTWIDGTGYANPGSHTLTVGESMMCETVVQPETIGLQ